MNNNSMVFKKKKPLLVFLIPAFLFLTVYLYYPFVRNVLNSFLNIDALGAPAKGVNTPWYENYVRIFTDPRMHTALINTLIMLLATIIFQVGLALVFALMVDNISHGAKFFRTVYFFPIVISATALGLLFNIIFLYDGGMVNNLLLKFGRTSLIDWKDEKHFMFTMLFPVIWQYVGYYFVIIITGLNNISTDIYEAAEIDGATGFQRVRFISLPLVYNTIVTCITLAITGSLKVFDLPYTMFPSGMPLDRSWLTGTYMQYHSYTTRDVDYSSTIAIVIVVLGVLLAQISNRALKEKDY